MKLDSFKITFNEIDFILPSYRYNIQFSYVSKQGLSFIREYILRLAQLGAISPNNIASYFGLNERETKEAISDLIKREELKYNEHNLIELTEKSQGYFESLGSGLNVSELRSSGSTLGFELTSLTCVSSTKKRLDKLWTQGFTLDMPSSKIANRDRLVSKAFQRHFQDLIEDGYMDHLKNKGGGKPSIYKVEALNQVGKDPYRLKLAFEMDVYGVAVETEDVDVLKDSSDVLELIAATINTNTRRNNYQEIINAIETLGDKYTSKLFSSTGFKVDEFIHLRSSDVSNNQLHIPFLGPLYSTENWKLFSELFNQEKKRLIAKHQEGVPDLKWLVPSNAFWGKNNQINTCLLELVNNAKTTGKKAKTLYGFQVMVPLANIEDHKEKKYWKHQFSSIKDSLHGYIDGYMDGDVEIVLLEDSLVAVTYFLNIPESYRVPVPIGFISTDKGMIDSIIHSLNSYLSEFYDQNNQRRDLGKL